MTAREAGGDDRARHLVLVGLMGAGKTSVGRVVASRLGRDCVDTDELAITLAGRRFDEIWADGEAAFRAWERQAIDVATASPVPLVIACGGGAVLDPHNRSVLRAAGIVVWLRADVATLVARVGDGSGRPLLTSSTGDPHATLARLAETRQAAYEAAAHVAVDTDGRSVEDVAVAVLAAARIDPCPP